MGIIFIVGMPRAVGCILLCPLAIDGGPCLTDLWLGLKSETGFLTKGRHRDGCVIGTRERCLMIGLASLVGILCVVGAT